MSSQFIELPPSGGGGVTSLNSLIGALTIAPGANITVTPSGGNTLTIAASGGLTTFPLLASNDTAAAPSYSWASNSGTGLYRSGANELAFSTAGTTAGHIDSSQNWIITKKIEAGSGSSSGYFFSAESTTGMFLGGLHSIDFNSNGISQLRISSTAVAFLNTSSVLFVPDGSASNPAISFLNSQTTGILSPTVNQIGISTNGVLAGKSDDAQQWSFGAPINPTRTHGFYKDVNAGDSTNSIILNIGNSGAAQGVGYFSYNGQVVTNSPSFDLGFSPRNNAGTAQFQLGLIRMEKSGGDDSGNMYFSTSDTGGTLNLAMTITPDGDLELAGENELRFEDAVGGQYVGFKAPATVTGTTTYTLPTEPPASNKVLQSDSSSVMTWVDQTAPTTPGGALGSIQWNNAGAFDGVGTTDGNDVSLPNNLTVANGLITSANLTNSFMANDGTKQLISLPGWNVGAIGGGAQVNLTETVASDNFGADIQNFEVEVDPSIATTNVNISGFNVDLHLDRTGSNNNYGGGVIGFSNTVSLEGTGAINSAFASNINFLMGIGTNSATVTNATASEIGSQIGAGYTVTNFNALRLDLSGAGTVTTGAMFTNIANTAVTNNLDLFYTSFGGGHTIGGNLRVFHGDINGDITTDAEGMNVGFSGNIGGNLNGFNFNSTGNVTGNLTGYNINASGAVTGNIKGMNIDLGAATSTVQKQGLSINDGSLTVQSNFDTGVLPASPGFFVFNGLGGNFHVAAGHPVSNTLIFGNNLGITSVFEDDMGPDAFGGFLGFAMNGFLSQFAVAVGKTVDTFNFMAAGAQVPTGAVPTDGGTVTNMTMFNALGTLNGGGSVVVTNMYGFKGGTNLSTYATNTWGVHISDPNADNWFKKNVVIGGVTGKPTGAFALDVTGAVKVSGNIASGTLTPANGASGTFTTVDLKTVTVVNGIITSIV